MFEAKAERGQIGVASGGSNPRHIIALIGISGPVRHGRACLPDGNGLGHRRQNPGAPVTVVDETVSDGVAEIVNIVAGGAKARMTKGEGKPLDLSLPTVVRGNSYTVEYPSQAVWLEVPFKSDLGEFSLG